MYSLSLSLFSSSTLPFPLDEGLSQSAQRVNGTRVQCANLTSQSECLFGQGQSLTALPTPSSKPSSLSLLLSLSLFIFMLSISFCVSPPLSSSFTSLCYPHLARFLLYLSLSITHAHAGPILFFLGKHGTTTVLFQQCA